MNNVADIDVAIRTREAEVEELRRRLEIAEAELRGMKLVRNEIGRALATQSAPRADARPAKARLRSGGYIGGRQPGAISRPWRLIYSDLYHAHGGGWFSEQQLVMAAFKRKIQIRPKDARDRLAAHAPYRIVEQDPLRGGGFWRVTEDAAKKFGFDKEPLKDEAPNADAPGPHESLAEGDQTGAE